MTRRFARSRDAKPVMCEIVKTNKSRHQTPIISFTVRVDMAEFARSAQMRVFRQRPKSYFSNVKASGVCVPLHGVSLRPDDRSWSPSAREIHASLPCGDC